jgi:hypothetical protein
MKLIFYINLSNDLEQTLAAARYKQFWEDNQDKILNSFYKHTGLTFQQKQITIRLRKDGISKAGNLLHAFQKKTQATPKKEINVARSRQTEVNRV